MQPFGFLLSLILHTLFLLGVIFYPAPTIKPTDGNKILISMVIGEMGGENLPSPVAGLKAPEIQAPSVLPDAKPTAQETPKQADNLKRPETPKEIPAELPKPIPVPPKPIEIPEAPKEIAQAPAPKIEEKTKEEPKEEPKEIKEEPKEEAPKPEPPREEPKLEEPKQEEPKPEPPQKEEKPKPAENAIENALADAKKENKPNKKPSKPKNNALDALAELAQMQSAQQASQAGGGGGSGSGNGGGGIYDVYAAQVILAVQPNWSMPTYSRQNLVVQIRIKLDIEGNVMNATIMESSGRADFDASAINAVIRTKKLPKPPTKDQQDLIISFNSLELAGN